MERKDGKRNRGKRNEDDDRCWEHHRWLMRRDGRAKTDICNWFRAEVRFKSLSVLIEFPYFHSFHLRSSYSWCSWWQSNRFFTGGHPVISLSNHIFASFFKFCFPTHFHLSLPPLVPLESTLYDNKYANYSEVGPLCPRTSAVINTLTADMGTYTHTHTHILRYPVEAISAKILGSVVWKRR